LAFNVYINQIAPGHRQTATSYSTFCSNQWGCSYQFKWWFATHISFYYSFTSTYLHSGTYVWQL